MSLAMLEYVCEAKEEGRVGGAMPGVNFGVFTKHCVLPLKQHSTL